MRVNGRSLRTCGWLTAFKTESRRRWQISDMLHGRGTINFSVQYQWGGPQFVENEVVNAENYLTVRGGHGIRSVPIDATLQPARGRHTFHHAGLVALRQVAVTLYHRHCAMAEDVGDLRLARTLTCEIARARVAKIVKSKVLESAASRASYQTPSKFSYGPGNPEGWEYPLRFHSLGASSLAMPPTAC